MVKIEAIIQPFKLDDVKVALEDLGITGITICHVLVHSGLVGQKTFYRGAAYDTDALGVKFELLVSSLVVDEVVDAISRTARTTTPGDDGTIMVSEVADAISVRSGQRVKFALT